MGSYSGQMGNGERSIGKCHPAVGTCAWGKKVEDTNSKSKTTGSLGSKTQERLLRGTRRAQRKIKNDGRRKFLRPAKISREGGVKNGEGSARSSNGGGRGV